MKDEPDKVKYRSKGRIFADILRAVQEDERAITTHILYKSNLSHDRLTKYLQNLEDGGLLKRSEEKDKTYYEITDKGKHFLSEFQRMEAFVSGFGLDI